MGKNKLKRFAANDINPNVVQEGKAIYTTIKGKWNSDFFTKNQPITLEIGCGNGEYTVGLAQHFGERNFIGCDIKGARIFKGSTEASEKNLQNVGFLRCRVEFILEFFEANEIDQIWITFPDPQLKDNREKHRLTHPRFLDLYKKILKPDGFIHLKTDSRELADFTLETLKTYPHQNLIHTFDLYHSALIAEHQGIQTKYERMFLGLSIEMIVSTELPHLKPLKKA
ncbi:MAG: tRNA (guanosine(46)-N7)-methyltransferase TrmB [Bacteroidetes bacterium]|nr:MAG: tRNA (guanosine(46)-N7)-methyltransferase TrmB [Bacteroidota bacterium]